VAGAGAGAAAAAGAVQVGASHDTEDPHSPTAAQKSTVSLVVAVGEHGLAALRRARRAYATALHLDPTQGGWGWEQTGRAYSVSPTEQRLVYARVVPYIKATTEAHADIIACLATSSKVLCCVLCALLLNPS
jgi:hypothetical protein